MGSGSAGKRGLAGAAPMSRFTTTIAASFGRGSRRHVRTLARLLCCIDTLDHSPECCEKDPKLRAYCSFVNLRLLLPSHILSQVRR